MSTTDKAPGEAPHDSAPADTPETPDTSAADATDLAAGAQLSTAPLEDAPSAPVGIGVLGWARWFWRQLTSMRVALILLFLLSLGSIPGSLVPQTQVDAMKVAEWKDKHEFWVPIAEKLQLFDVYSSVWFSAIYILLFVSLIGCIVPRTWQFIGQLSGRPPGAPRRLDRLPAYATWRTEKSPEEVLASAKTLLGGRRFRTDAAGTAVAAEKGYLREAGNLAFHIALIFMLVAFAVGQLYKSEGGKLVLRGKGFSNTLTQYDDFKYGGLFSPDSLPPFSFTLDKFDATYETSGPQKGTPRDFKAYVSFSEGAHGKPVKTEIEVNKPLEIDGSKVFLLGHGYAPVISVTGPDGKVIFKDAVPMLPFDANLSSSGAVKVTDGYKDKDGKQEQLGFNAMFVPTFAGEGKGTMLSQFPALDFPVLALSAYHGSLGVDSGLPQNVYQLNTSKMKEFKDEQGELFKKRLLPGETMTLPDGAGTVKFEGIERWATFSVTQQPANGLALAGAIVAIGGLAASLFIQRRRIWVRAVTGKDGVTVVEMAGLGRSESARLPEELAVLSAALHQQAPSAPGQPVKENVEGERG
ncbi:cytochrome c biogenesis protein ResB [Streptomyces sp. NPDC054904]|uniref:cytochrome c biogenesis protein ResB n=1 Tax=unclassified Streptomyces TaxID=2593676 RepID=UPI002481ABBD|nr:MULTISPECIES: cytochrome c biogenesis protein ResB [unclassified Streptomyces]MDA5281598.1 cytochrome c biogenesis protein ResB [Streptomyces sp. Isolate_45]MDX2395565.1 cytochrome c biogenesis protein ResB [Streptomyces sp. DK15]